MGKSSAEPARLEAYPGELTEADDALTTLATNLDTAMQAFSSGAGSYLPANFDSTWAGTTVRGLRDESRHLGSWVASVGAAFRAAANGDPDGDGIFTADNTFLAPRVGEPTVAGALAEAKGRQDARDLRQALIDAGIDPDNFDPAQLQQFVLNRDDAKFRELYQKMQGMGGSMWDPAYAGGFYDEMGTEGIRATLGVIDTYAYLRHSGGLLEDDRDWMGSVEDELLLPFVGGWALATRSPDTEDERAGLLDTRDPVDQRHLSLLMAGNPTSYDSQWLADGANRILVTGKDLNREQYPSQYPSGLDEGEYPGLGGSGAGWLYDDKGLAVPSLIATRALAGNTDASATFLNMGQDQREALIYPDPIRIDSTMGEDTYNDLVREYEETTNEAVSDVITHDDPAVREPVMSNVIDTVAANQDQTLRPAMAGTLADGVEANIELVDRRINGGFTDLDGDGNYELTGDPATLQDTSAFLKEVMHDDAARDKIRATTAAYVQGNLGDLPVDEDGMRDRPEVLDNGRILGVVTESDIAAAAEDIQSEKDEDARRAKIIDFAINWAGPAGRIHGGAAVFTNWTLGEKGNALLDDLLGETDIADLEDGLRDLAVELQGQIEGQPVHERDRDTMKAGASDVGNEL